MLKCPKCGNILIKQDHSYCCCEHHSFDIAKRGYVNLLLGNHKATGDDKEMVKARTEFLNHGYYQSLLNRLIQLLSEKAVDVLVDAGCGQGYYTNALHEALDCHSFGFDLSKYAVDEASKAHNGVFYGVCNIFHMPLSDACADALISVFAPIDIKENARVLKQNGLFLRVAPGPRHLLDMKQVLYADVYENETDTGYEGFELISEELLEDPIEIRNKADIKALFQMTPYYWRTPKESAEKLLCMDALDTVIQFHITCYRKL